MSPTGRLLASNDDRSEDTNSRIPDSGSISLSESGVHTIEVASYDSDGSGSYALSLVRASDSTALTCSAIDLDQVVTASLDPGDGGSRNRSGVRADCYTFSGEAGARLTAALDSLDFDAYLYLMDEEGEIIESDDDGGSGTDSRATVTLPFTGGYIIEATAWDDEGEGTYTLSLTPEAIPVSLVCSTISLGQTVAGELATIDGSSSNRAGSLADCYTFSSATDERIAISLSSDDFDAYLYLLDTDGEVLDFDDDGGSGTDSRIGGFNLVASTLYTIEATAFDEGETGSFTLSLTQVSLTPSTDCSLIVIGDLVQATLDVGDGESRNQSDSYADCYTFSGSAGDQVDISMSSDDFDTVVYLSNEEGEVLADDDDGGDGTNSRIFSFE
jgi:hypothetical protein